MPNETAVDGNEVMNIEEGNWNDRKELKPRSSGVVLTGRFFLRQLRVRRFV